MFNRLIVAVQILSVITCPVWCEAGTCVGSDCISARTPSSAASLFASNKCACCCHSPQERQSSERSPLTPDPEKSSCQGICGGAILEQPIHVSSNVASVLVVLADVSGLSQYLDSFSCEFSERDSGSSLHGRLLRVMQQSFQC